MVRREGVRRIRINRIDFTPVTGDILVIGHDRIEHLSSLNDFGVFYGTV